MKKSTAKSLGYQPLSNNPRSASPLDSQYPPHGLDRVVADHSRTRPSTAHTLDHRRSGHTSRSKSIATSSTQIPTRLHKDRFISLPESLSGDADLQQRPPSIFEDLPSTDALGLGLRGRITVYCLGEMLDRKMLEGKLKGRGGSWLLAQYPDVIHGIAEVSPALPTSNTVTDNNNTSTVTRPPGHLGGGYTDGNTVGRGDVFYFDYGIVVFWGLTVLDEHTVLRSLVSGCVMDPLPKEEVEEFAFNFSPTEKPHIQNDTFTINGRLDGDAMVKLSISHALAQSTKLAIYEARVMEIVEDTRDLPEILANTGRVTLGRKAISQIIGQVFIQKSAVNLLSTVLDTPEFFWSAPDAMQALYKRACDYLEYDTRVEVLNARFGVLEEMLSMLRDHQNNSHTARLEWIVIWLVLIEVVVGLFECASILGWLGKESGMEENYDDRYI